MFIWAKTFQGTLKLEISFSLEHFFMSVAIFTQVALAPLKGGHFTGYSGVGLTFSITTDLYIFKTLFEQYFKEICQKCLCQT